MNETNSKGDKLLDVDKMAFKMTVFHEFECYFYNNLAPVLEIPTPKVFETVSWILKKQEGCLHMEDLSRRAKVLTFFDSFNMTQLKNITKNIVHMHKQILTLEKEKWEGKYLENQLCFLALAPMYNKAIEDFKKLTKEKYPTASLLIEKYQKFFTNEDFVKFAFADSYKTLNIDPVLVHGDLWTPNIMITVDDDGNFTNEITAFVDWQACHEGSPMDDFAR
ncbi:hypothetical protein FO519_010491, partial [Halicephalobus sp. NKZ332]